MRVHVVDPAAYTPPYDHALSGALARAGAEVELVTCRFPYGPVPTEEGYEVDELFYRRASGPGAERPRRAGSCAPPSTSRTCSATARRPRDADVVHYQWLPIPELDRRLLAPVHPASSRCTGASRSPAAASPAP